MFIPFSSLKKILLIKISSKRKFLEEEFEFSSKLNLFLVFDWGMNISLLFSLPDNYNNQHILFFGFCLKKNML